MFLYTKFAVHFFQVCSTQNPEMPTLASSPYSASLIPAANPPDEIFLDRLAERFSQHAHIDVGGRPSSSATTTTTTSGPEDDNDDNGDDRRDEDEDEDKACSDEKQLHQHCFRLFKFRTKAGSKIDRDFYFKFLQLGQHFELSFHS
jgi:hypothetical protein